MAMIATFTLSLSPQYKHTDIYIYLCISIYLSIYISISIYVHKCMYIFVFTCTYTFESLWFFHVIHISPAQAQAVCSFILPHAGARARCWSCGIYFSWACFPWPISAKMVIFHSLMLLLGGSRGCRTEATAREQEQVCDWDCKPVQSFYVGQKGKIFIVMID